MIGFNALAYTGYTGSCGLFDEKDLKLITDSALYGFFAVIFLASLNLGYETGFSTYQVARVGFTAFTASIILTETYHKYVDRINRKIG